MVAPLEGIRVIEVANWLAAPSAAALMADLGASVVKIENPVGDAWRTTLMRGRKSDFDPDVDVDAPYELDNRGKRGVALSLEAPGAGDLVKRMVAEADVFITNLTAPRIARSSQLRSKTRIPRCWPISPAPIAWSSGRRSPRPLPPDRASPLSG